MRAVGDWNPTGQHQPERAYFGRTPLGVPGKVFNMAYGKEHDSVLSHNPYIRKQQESNRQTQDGWRRFTQHREQVHQLVEASAPSSNATLCVLGAGNCNDLNLHRLLETFVEVHLVDLDLEGLKAALDRQSVARLPGIHLHAPLDLTGLIDHLPPPGATMQPPEIERLAEQLRQHSLPLADAQFDVVLSAAVLTQMFQSVEDAGLEPGSTLDLVVELRRQHLRVLLELARSGGAVVLVTDVVSTATAPELPTLVRRRLGTHLAQLINQRNFFTGANPVQLQDVLMKDLDIAPMVDQVAFYEPWLWSVTTRHQHLVYAVTFRKQA